MRSLPFFAALLLFFNLVSAATLAPGEYIMERGGGHLKISPSGPKNFKFAIETIGANAHTCSLDGEIINGKATQKEDGFDKPCIIKFEAKNDGIEVSHNEAEVCRFNCGMRAYFEGLYLKPAAACGDQSRQKTRREFKRLYDQKSYREALAILQPLLDNCSRTLDWLESGRIRNDLAVTLHKLQMLPECRAVLEPLAADAKGSDAAIREQYPPTDAESYLPIVRSTRTNLKLCSDKK